MNKSEIQTIVEAYLSGLSVRHVQEIFEHGIHNLTNEFCGGTDAEYEALSTEFHEQAGEMLRELEMSMLNKVQS